MEVTEEASFLDHFKDIEDPRSTRNRLYTMSEILFVTLCAAVCGTEGWQDVEDFGEAKIDNLRRFLPYKNGIPSDDTYRRFFRAVDPTKVQELFRDWVKSLQCEINGKHIAIDGKSSRHSFDEDLDMLHMVSAYATEVGLVLAQEKVSEKSNEITAIPKLLEWLDLRGSTITIDAMGCQYAIANQILKKEGHYIFALKGNQGDLCKDVETYLNDQELKAHTNISSFKSYDKGHGQIETRQCWVTDDVAWLRERHPQWSSINSIIRIDSTREIKDKTTCETRFYVSSLTQTPHKTLATIRNHWAI